MRLDVLGERILDLPHEHVLRDRRRDVYHARDLEHAVYVLLGICDEDRVRALEHLEQPLRGLEPLQRLLRLRDLDVLERDHLAHHAPLLREVALVLHLKRDAVRTHGLARQGAKELLPPRLEHDAVHREDKLDRLKVLLLGEYLPLERAERDLRLGEVWSGDHGLAHLVRIRLQHQRDVRLVERQRRDAVRSARHALQVFAGHRLLGLLPVGGRARAAIRGPLAEQARTVLCKRHA